MRPSMLNDPNVDDAAKADGEVTEPVTEETPANDLSEL